MKKISLLSILSAFLVFVAANNSFAGDFGGTIKLGIDLPGDYEISNYESNGTVDVDTGFSISGEFFALSEGGPPFLGLTGCLRGCSSQFVTSGDLEVR